MMRRASENTEKKEEAISKFRAKKSLIYLPAAGI